MAAGPLPHRGRNDVALLSVQGLCGQISVGRALSLVLPSFCRVSEHSRCVRDRQLPVEWGCGHPCWYVLHRTFGVDSVLCCGLLWCGTCVVSPWLLCGGLVFNMCWCPLVQSWSFLSGCCGRWVEAGRVTKSLDEAECVDLSQIPALRLSPFGLVGLHLQLSTHSPSGKKQVPTSPSVTSLVPPCSSRRPSTSTTRVLPESRHAPGRIRTPHDARRSHCVCG